MMRIVTRSSGNVNNREENTSVSAMTDDMAFIGLSQNLNSSSIQSHQEVGNGSQAKILILQAGLQMNQIMPPVISIMLLLIGQIQVFGMIKD